MAFPPSFQYAVELNLNTNEVTWDASWDHIKEVEFVQSAAAQLTGKRDETAIPAEDVFIVAAGTEWVIFRADWETGDGDLELVAPDGTAITPANVDTFTNIGYYKEFSCTGGLLRGAVTG